ncbi:RluA family pseudouridine synthase [Haloferula chungangensis]|uniref:tRNA pseudouridine synthase C n=1 Tax=Haloferula chungangensis TaxID=1048331 RepID=A0ABW2L6E4_9BACT
MMEALRILYQDDCLVAIDKPAGMIVHPGREPEGPEWIAMKRVRDQLDQRVYPIHRLDRPTSGVLLFALDKATSSLAQQSFERREVKKEYLAVVSGRTEQGWCCDSPLRKDPDAPLLDARTCFERIAFQGEGATAVSLLGAVPETGRFHQIRRHLLECGFPIVGDYRYAGRERSDELGAYFGTGDRMLLQARVLTLRHPHTGEGLRIEAPVDGEISRCFPEWGREGKSGHP